MTLQIECARPMHIVNKRDAAILAAMLRNVIKRLLGGAGVDQKQ